MPSKDPKQRLENYARVLARRAYEDALCEVALEITKYQAEKLRENHPDWEEKNLYENAAKEAKKILADAIFGSCPPAYWPN